MSLIQQTTINCLLKDEAVLKQQEEARQKVMGRMFFKERIRAGAQVCQGPGVEDKGCDKRVAANKLWCWNCYLEIVRRNAEASKTEGVTETCG